MTPAMDPFLGDGWKTIPLITREVRLDADGTPWTGQRDPVRCERVRDVYHKLCEWGETGRQIVAIHQEITADLQVLARARKDEQLTRAVKAPRRKLVKRGLNI